MTRSTYLLKFLCDDIDMDELKKVFPNSYEMIYCTYNILSDFGIKDKEIISADADSDNMSIGIEFSNKKIPKIINKQEDKYTNIQGLRDNDYSVSIKVKSRFIFFEFIKK